MYTACLRLRLLAALCLSFTLPFALPAHAQSYDMTMDVLVNSADPTGYNTSRTAPGEYQRYPERYFEHLQIPYRVIDTATQAPPAALGSVQLIVAGHRGLALTPAWQQAIAAAVAGGTGFVNLDSDPAIGTNTHMQQIFGATGSAASTAATTISIPSAVAPGGAAPHYIAALQLRFARTPAGDLTYLLHQDANGVTNAITPTVLQGAKGVVIAQAGANPLIVATQTAGGRAVDFTTYDYMRPDRFGFVMGIDDLFWRSLVWAARKPFVLRGYPHYFALQLDDEVADFPSRFPDLWNTGYTGTVNPDGTGGPWKSTAMAQFVNIEAGGTDRAAAISEINSGNLKLAFHTMDGASEGDLYWNADSSTPLTDAQWKNNLGVALQTIQGDGGADVLPPLSKSMNPHFWNLSNNVGYDMWHSFGTRYITEIQQPGAYFNSSPAKTDAQRIGGRPFRLYELPPSYGEPNDIWPIYTADDLVVGSTAGLPPVTFFSFCTQLLGSAFPTFDAKWPSTSDGYSVSYSVDNFTEYAWRFWSSQAPVQVYSHDGGNYERSTAAQRGQAITQISSFLNTHAVRHVFMEDMGAYMRARVKSVLTSATASPSTLTLNFTGTAADADGNQIPTYFYTYYGDDEGLLQKVPGFSNGYTYAATNAAPPRIAFNPAQLALTGTPGGSVASRTVALANTGGAALPFTTQSDSPWLTVTPVSDSAPSTLTVTADPSSLAAGTYSGVITVASAAAVNAPQQLPVSFTVKSPSLSAAPLALTFNGSYGGASPAPKSVTIANTGGGKVSWTASSNAAWLQLSALSGTAPSTLTLTANIAGLAVGTYSATVSITSSGSQNSPQQVAVTFAVANTLLQTGFPGTTLDGWAYSPQGSPQNWSVANGALSYSGNGAAQIYAGNAGWTDYSVQSTFQLSSLSNYPGGVRARVNPATGAAYIAWLYPAEGVIRLFRSTQWDINSSGLQQLGVSGALSFDTTSLHTLAISAQGSALTVLYDGKSVVTATDSTLSAGLIALDVSNRPVKFQNVLVTSALPGATTLTTSPGSLTYNVAPGSVSSQTILVAANDNSVAAYSALPTVRWVSVAASSGVTPATLTVTVDATSLTAGTYSTGIPLTSFGAANSPVSLPVTVNVSGSASQASATSLTFAPASFDFVGSASSTNGFAPAQTGKLSSSQSPVAWQASRSGTWLVPSPLSGTTPATLTLNANGGGLTPGTYKDALVITPAASSGAAVLSVPVSFRIGTLLFSDTFTDASHWTVSPQGLAAKWSTANNTFRYSGGARNTQQYAGANSWGNYTLQADVNLPTASNYPGGFRFRLNTATGTGYAFWLYPGSSQVAFYRVPQWNIDTSYTTLSTANGVLLAAGPHHVRVDVIGAAFTAYIDNVKVLTAIDSTYTAGAIALDVSNQAVTFSNISVIQ